MIQRLAVPRLASVIVCLLLTVAAPVKTATADPEPSPAASSLPVLGVVWAAPSSPDSALQDLERIHASGATGVRVTHVPETDTVLSRADSLDLRLFVDLPVTAVSASALHDSIEAHRQALERIETQARRHSSVKYVGLAQHVDTTVPEACSVLRQWTKRLHEGGAQLQTYYVTSFPASTDRCAGAVDLPLLDTRGRSDAAQQWQEWTSDNGRAGLGALGTWVRPGAPSGLRVPHSPEHQARHLEDAFSELLDTLRARPPAVFVHRWQDQSTSTLPSRHYGLYDGTDVPRPAADVVEGFYTGTQRVFAFTAGSSPSGGPYGLIVLGWALVAILGVLYTQNPFFRQTATRYFVAHGFYRDAIRRGRNVAPGVNILLFGVVGTALGMCGALWARAAASQPLTEQLLDALPPAIRTVAATGILHPSLSGVVIGGLSMLVLGAWILLLVLVARTTSRFSVAQGLMLVVWPCWPVLLAMILGLLATSQPPFSTKLLAGVVLAGGMGVTLLMTLRVLRDYSRVTKLPLPVILILFLPSPFVLVGAALAYLVVQYDPPLTLLWHLISRT